MISFQHNSLNLHSKLNGHRYMSKMLKKANFPKKICAVCGLPFAWRKKWARDWEQVRYCSKRCAGTGKSSAKSAG